MTSHTRDANQRITRTDYPDGAYETFSYNSFGQVLTHQMKNGTYERFAYDARGLLTDKWNPKFSVPVEGDPHAFPITPPALDGWMPTDPSVNASGLKLPRLTIRS